MSVGHPVEVGMFSFTVSWNVHESVILRILSYEYSAYERYTKNNIIEYNKIR